MSTSTQPNCVYNDDPLTKVFLKGVLIHDNQDMTDLLHQFLVALVINSLLIGVCFTFTYRYFSTFPGDHWFNKMTVIAMACLCGYQYLMAQVVYGRELMHRDDYAHIYDKDLTGNSLIISVWFWISFCSQSFFLQRAYRLYNQNKIILIVLGPMILGVFVTGIVSQYHGLAFAHVNTDTFQLKDLKALGLSYKGLGEFMRKINTAITAVSLTIDVFITSLIVIRLLMSKTAFANTNSAIKKLIILIIESMFPGLCLQIVQTIVANMKFGIAGLVRVVYLIQTPIVFWAVLLALNSRSEVTSILSSQGGRTASHLGFSGISTAKNTFPLGSFSKEAKTTDDGADTLVTKNDSSNTLPYPNNSVLVEVSQTKTTS